MVSKFTRTKLTEAIYQRNASRILAMGLVMLLLFVTACSKKNKTETAAEPSTDEPVEETVEAKATDKDLAEDLFQLMKQAETQNAQGLFDDSYASWKKIHQHVSQKYGLDGWQTISAELAMSAARQRTKMSQTDQELAKELTKLTSSATVAIEKQNFNEARIDIEKAAGISVRLWGKESYVSANVNFLRARCYLGLGMNDRAIAVLNDVLGLRIALTGMYHPDVETTLDMLSKANSALKNYVAAQQSLEKLVDVSSKLWGEDNDAYATRCNELAVNYNNGQKPNLAMPWFNKALSIRQKLHGEEDLSAGHVYLNRGMAQMQLKEFDKAKQDLDQALAIFKKSELNIKNSAWPLLYDQLGTIALLQKENADGQQYFSQLADYWKNREGETHLEYGKSLYKLSVSIGNQGRYNDAEPIMKKAISIFESKLGYTNKMLHQPLTTYARLLEKMGVEQEAQKIKDRAVRLAGFQELPN